MKTITIANQKGGVGKTTTAQTFACGLALKGYKVLAIDCDSQGNMSFTFNQLNKEKTIFEVLQQENIFDCITHTEQKVDLIPASDKLFLADTLFNQSNDIYRLKVQLQKLNEVYDFCIIDTPPSLNLITKNCFIASDSVIIPMHTDLFSMQGLSQLLKTIEEARKKQKEQGLQELSIDGILLTEYNNRTILNRTLSHQIEKISKQTGLNVFNSTIRSGILVREAQNNQSNIFKENPRANVTKDYENFIKEYLKKYYKKETKK